MERKKHAVPQSNRREEAAASRDLEIVQDCVNLVNTTNDPRVFFQRYELMMDKLYNLSMLERTVSFSGTRPSVMLRDIQSKRNSETNTFLSRYLQRMKEESEAMKTDKAKIKKIDTLYASLMVHSYAMDESNLDYFKSGYAKLTGLPSIIDIENWHYENLEKIKMQYSVLNNLKTYNGEAMDSLIELCYFDISLAERLKDYWLKAWKELPNYETFKRLAIIFEKRKEYDKAIEICVQAIETGFTKDGTDGQMYGRLAKLISKSGKDIPPKIQKLIQKGIEQKYNKKQTPRRQPERML